MVTHHFRTDRDMLSGYVTKRLNEHDKEHGQASPHTVSKELITIRRALREAHDRGVRPTMPAFPRFSPKYQPREVWLTPDQFERVCAELHPKRVLWASLAALGGMRSGEAERLRWETVIERLVRVPGTKTDQSRRTVPIAPALQLCASSMTRHTRTLSSLAVTTRVPSGLNAALHTKP